MYVKIYYSPKFASQYKKLPREVKLKGRKKERLFLINPFDPRLKTHKLAGSLADYWSFSIDYKYRVIFKFIEKQTVRFHLVGTHDIYKN